MRSPRRWIGFALLLAPVLSSNPRLARSAAADTVGQTPTSLCTEAIRASETTYGLPPGLLAAIGEVESGRLHAASGRLEPWPWTVQSEDQSWYFATKRQAVNWVREAKARGVTSIDTGCLQVNLFYHPRAFDSLDDAFDPRANVDYAARFLLQLHGRTGDWQQATGFYHSQTSALAASYEVRVKRQLNSPNLPWPAAPKPATKLTRLASAWQATVTPAAPPASQAGNSWSVLLRRPPGAAPTRLLRVTTR